MGTSGVEEGESIALTVDGGYIISGYNFDFWIVKLAPDPLEVPEFDGNKIVLYPNPVQEFFTIDTKHSGNYTLMTLNGQLLKGGLITNGHNDIYIPALAGGVYFIKALQVLTKTLGAGTWQTQPTCSMASHFQLQIMMPSWQDGVPKP